MKTRHLLFLIFWAMTLHTYGQGTNIYSTSIIEFPFTWANVTDNGMDLDGPVRFAPFFNFQNNINFDFSEKFGAYLGLGIHNVGFVYNVDEFERKKVRTYNLGIPVGFKLGNMDNVYFFGGYEFEIPFHYREKTFINEEKEKFGTWFSERTPLQQSVHVGVQMPYGASFKFKYYFTNFYKQSYSELSDSGTTVKPYENFTANVFWISLNYTIFRNTGFYY